MAASRFRGFRRQTSSAPHTLPSPPRRRRELDPARQDRELFARLLDASDPVDRQAVVERFLPLARRLAARYQQRDEPFEDVLQVACFGLVKAIDRFDADRGVAFTSYAVPTIAGEIKRHYRDHTWAVRVPRDLQDLALRVDRVAGELTRRLRRPPSVGELARAVGVDDEDVLEALEAVHGRRAESLDAPRADDDADSGPALVESIGRLDDGYAQAEQRALLHSLMRSLTPREREVLRLRFEEDLTQRAIGRRIGISQMQVSRTLRHAIARLRRLARTEELGEAPHD
jgi:RNA polymerase sigma-B factor